LTWGWEGYGQSQAEQALGAPGGGRADTPKYGYGGGRLQVFPSIKGWDSTGFG